jgi:hypothetical protein
MIRPAEFKIARYNAETGVTLSVTGELDLSTVPQRLLIELNQRAQREWWSLTLTALKLESAAIVLRTTGADSVLPFGDLPDR